MDHTHIQLLFLSDDILQFGIRSFGSKKGSIGGRKSEIGKAVSSAIESAERWRLIKSNKFLRTSRISQTGLSWVKVLEIVQFILKWIEYGEVAVRKSVFGE